MKQLVLAATLLGCAAGAISAEVDGYIYLLGENGSAIRLADKEVYLCCQTAEIDSFFGAMTKELKAIRTRVDGIEGHSSLDAAEPGPVVSALSSAEYDANMLVSALIEFFRAREIASTRTTIDGNFAFLDIGPGDYCLFATHSIPLGSDSFSRSFMPSALSGKLLIWAENFEASLAPTHIELSPSRSLDLCELSGLAIAQDRANALFAASGDDDPVLLRLVQARIDASVKSVLQELPDVFAHVNTGCAD